MLKIKCISNVDHYMRFVESSKGDVFLHLPGYEKFNLKKSEETAKLLPLLKPETSGLSISLSDNRDFPLFLQYMLEAA